MKQTVSRRRFLGEACRCGAAVVAGGAALSISGCGQTVESEQSTIARVENVHRRLGGLPDNPVAVAQTERSLMYPPIGNPSDYDRGNNPCYPLVEEALMLLNPADLANPLGNVVRPGDVVVIKPNWCTQYIFPIPITHPSLVHAVVELAARAGAAKVRIVEAPMTMTYAATWFYGRSFLNMASWLEHLARKHPETVFEHQDGNADDFTWVFLDDRSLLKDIPREGLCHDSGPVKDDMFYDVPDSQGFDPRGYRHGLYAIANSYLDCDVFINLPKMKTHAWTGVTLALKNMMGLNLMSTLFRMPPDRMEEHLASKDLSKIRECGMRDVPHFDSRYVTIERRSEAAPANDVLWRSLADLNRIILYCDRQGRLQPTPQRRRLNVVDGIIGTEGDGPITDSRVYSRTIVAGVDPVRVDAVCARVMGYDPESVPLIVNSGGLASGPAFGQLEDYGESIVCAAGAGTLPRVHPYAPPVIWRSSNKLQPYRATGS
ncbi:MAG: DUF362 domain-containing protein [Pirellulales bacterium]|nr:DUF362 domain-containing protein [Pirellulales bacterium]